MSVKVTAPGSLMLMGEYAVLHGKRALVCAVDKRMTVVLTPRTDKKIIIRSALGNHECDLEKIEVVAPFQFVLTAIKNVQKKMKSGCEIEITTEFSDKIGFGSSAAVTVATVTALMTWLHLPYSKLELVRVARNIIRQVQGAGSGADVAACVFGGIIEYHSEPLTVEKLKNHYPLTVIYSGSKTPTPDAIKKVDQYFSDYPLIFQQFCKTIDTCVSEGKKAITNELWSKLGKLMNIQQGVMESLGVSNTVLQTIISSLRESDVILGAKISGSGFGDCVIALGELPASHAAKGEKIPVNITDLGVQCEKN